MLENKAARLILDLPAHSSASEALKTLGWKPLVSHTVPILFNGDFHGYDSTSIKNICKSTANRKWGHWSSIKFSSEIWNRLDPAIREAESLTAFKRGLSKAIL